MPTDIWSFGVCLYTYISGKVPFYADGELEMLEQLIPAAVNQANGKAKQLHAEAMQEMTSGLDVPGLNEAA